MTREQAKAGRNLPTDPAMAALTRNDMADYVRLCELGESLERAAARWAREQAGPGPPAHPRHGRGIVLAAVVIGVAITLLGVVGRRRPSRRPASEA